VVARRRTAVVGVHVLLAALALGAVAIWGPGTDPARADLRVSLPDPDPRLPAIANTLSVVRPRVPLVLDTTKHQQGAPLDSVMPELEADTLDAAGAVNVKARVARDGGFSRGVWQIAIRDSADPNDALRAADELYAAGGWARAPSDDDAVLVRKQTPSAQAPLAAYRAHYVYGPYLIRIEAYGPDAGRVDREFAELAGRQLAEWPADGMAR
jgi:hypothetical protein